MDDLLERAGCQDVVHLHGSLTRMRCTACGHAWDVGHAPWDHASDRCPPERCRSLRGVKPDVVFFGEESPLYRLLHAEIRGLRAEDVVLVVGTNCGVIPFHHILRGRPGHKVI